MQWIYPIFQTHPYEYLCHSEIKKSTSWGPCCVCHRSNECNLRPEGCLGSRQLIDRNNLFNCGESNITTECIRTQIWVCRKIWCPKKSRFIIMFLIESLFFRYTVYPISRQGHLEMFKKWMFLIHPHCSGNLISSHLHVVKVFPDPLCPSETTIRLSRGSRKTAKNRSAFSKSGADSREWSRS